MKPQIKCPAWCSTHVPDYDGWLRHTVDLGTTRLPGDQGELPVVVERVDPAPNFTPTEAYIWLPYGEGVALSPAAAQSHVGLLILGLRLLTAGQGGPLGQVAA